MGFQYEAESKVVLTPNGLIELNKLGVNKLGKSTFGISSQMGKFITKNLSAGLYSVT